MSKEKTHIYLSCIKKSIRLLLSKQITIRRFVSVCHNMYDSCKDSYMGTDEYVRTNVFNMTKEERDVCLAQFKAEYSIKKGRREWSRRFFEDKAFFYKYASSKYESSKKLQKEKFKAYQERFNMPDDSYIGENVIFRCSHYIRDYEPKLVIGHRVSFTENVFVDWTGQVYIGDNVCITNGVVIESHIQDLREFARTGESVDIPTTLRIGNNVYIGSRAIVLGTCTSIGDNSVIAANAVVTKDVPANCLVAGVPARVIKRINME